MSLTSFVERPEVIDKIRPLRPKLGKIAAPLKVEPRSNRSGMVGTAFDYLLRFELHRRAPHAVVEPWVAEKAPDTIWGERPRASGNGVILSSWLRGAPDALVAQEQRKRAQAFLDKAKAAVTAHRRNKSPTHEQVADLAAHAIRLANLDGP